MLSTSKKISNQIVFQSSSSGIPSEIPIIVMKMPFEVTYWGRVLMGKSVMYVRLSVFALVLLALGACYSKQDEGQALKAAEKIHSEFQNGDFRGVYKESAQGLKQAVSESGFIDSVGRIYTENGAIRKITPVAYQSGMDSKSGPNHILLFDVEFERLRVRERMVFVRLPSGQMELWDLVVDRLP